LAFSFPEIGLTFYLHQSFLRTTPEENCSTGKAAPVEILEPDPRRRHTWRRKMGEEEDLASKDKDLEPRTILQEGSLIGFQRRTSGSVFPDIFSVEDPLYRKTSLPGKRRKELDPDRSIYPALFP